MIEVIQIVLSGVIIWLLLGLLISLYRHHLVHVRTQETVEEALKEFKELNKRS